jgi:hypothetical protein
VRSADGTDNVYFNTCSTAPPAADSRGVRADPAALNQAAKVQNASSMSQTDVE